MPPRIILLHAYRYSMAPIDEAFRTEWPEATAIRLLDETLYADAGADGTLPANIGQRLQSLFRHCVLSGADGIVFTGSTFGPAVEAARAAVKIPILKADEAMADAAVARANRILILATAKRALPVLRGNVEAAAAAAGVQRHIAELWVPGAQAANTAGRAAEHAQLIADAAAAAQGYDLILLGQMSMTPAIKRMPPQVAAQVLSSPSASVARMRQLLGAG